MSAEITSAALLYSGQQISALNKVLAGEGYIIQVGVTFIDEGDDGVFWISGTWDDNIPGIATQDKTYAQISTAISAASPQLPVYKLTGYNSETLVLPLKRLTSTEATFDGSYLTYANSKYSLRHITVTVTASASTLLDTTINDAEGGSF